MANSTPKNSNSSFSFISGTLILFAAFILFAATVSTITFMLMQETPKVACDNLYGRIHNLSNPYEFTITPGNCVNFEGTLQVVNSVPGVPQFSTLNESDLRSFSERPFHFENDNFIFDIIQDDLNLKVIVTDIK